jgi:cadmium resistance protein CadD (predicted permease)
VSLLGALGLTVIPDRWVGLLGLVPFALGLRGLINTLRGRVDAGDVAPAGGVLGVAGVTIANGADNLSVYIPIFRTVGTAETVVIVAVFAVLVAVWCLASSWLGSHRKVIPVVERFGHWIVPIVFMLLGVLIVVESRVLG